MKYLNHLRRNNLILLINWVIKIANFHDINELWNEII